MVDDTTNSTPKPKVEADATANDAATGEATPAPAPPPKPKRGGSKPILKTSGIGRVENQMKQTTIQVPTQINQKNYYTEYLKKDDQIMFYREFAEEQKRQKELKELKKQQEEQAKEEKEGGEEGEDEEKEDKEAAGSKVIVIHPGSQNLRIGLASQAYPYKIPNVIAHRMDGESENGGEPMDISNGEDDEAAPADEQFDAAHKVVQDDLTTRMKFYKRRILPNSAQTVSNYNARMEYEEIPDHNDPYRVEWTNVSEKPAKYYTGEKATRIPPNSNPKYKLRWPIRYGMFNEKDYDSPQQVLGDISLIYVDALEQSMNITFKDYKDYNVILLIPDLYDKSYVSNMVSLILGMGFANVAILQESMGATFGAGISAACIIDVGAQKTSVSCVEEGMVISDSRVSLRYGGDDITSALTKMLLKSKFPYDTIDLSRQYDWDTANYLKEKFGTTNDADVAIQLYNFYQRSPNRQTRKYHFKTFDEVMLAPLGLFYPELFELEYKISKRYSLFPRSIDIYDDGTRPNDAISDAQINLHRGTLASEGKSYTNETVPVTQSQTPVPQSQQQGQGQGTGTGTNATNTAAATPAPAAATNGEEAPTTTNLTQSQALAELDQNTIPYVGLDHAIIESITNAALKSQGAKVQTFYENLMIVGGGSAKFPGFNNLLTDRIGMFAQRETGPKYNGDIQVMPIPREMDPELITWKGGGVYSKLKIVQEVWINSHEWDVFGSRCLQYKVLFLY